MDEEVISTLLEEMDTAPTTTARGRALEELIAHMFAACHGVRHYRNNTLNQAGSAEIDVCFWNSRSPGFLDFLPAILVVECKNVSHRIGSAEIGTFINKLANMRLEYGIFVAAQGITGTPENLRAAHDTIRTAAQVQKIKLIVLTRDELVAIREATDLVVLIQNKLLDLTVGAQSF